MKIVLIQSLCNCIRKIVVAREWDGDHFKGLRARGCSKISFKYMESAIFLRDNARGAEGSWKNKSDMPAVVGPSPNYHEVYFVLSFTCQEYQREARGTFIPESANLGYCFYTSRPLAGTFWALMGR